MKKLIWFAIAFFSAWLTPFPALAQTTPPATTGISATLLPPLGLTIRIVPDELGEVDPGDTVTYTVYYQNSGDTPVTSITLSLFWNFTSDEVADYVLNSASQAYGGSLPTVDLINKTITWTIPSLPGGEGVQQASFQLQTRSTHPYPGTYFFSVNGQIGVAGSTPVTAEQVTNSVTYQEGLPPVKPPVGEAGLLISGVQLLEVTAHHALISWETNIPSDGVIRYGLSKAYGLEKSSLKRLVTDHRVSLDDLDPDTIYHFQVVVQSDNQQVESEDYLFKTAQEGAKVPTVDIGSLLFRGYGLRLHPDTKGVLPMFPLVDLEVELPVYGEGLAVNLDLSGRLISLFPQDPPWFSGSFTAPSGVGEYQIVAETVDRVGNYIRTDLTVLFVVSRPQVKDTSQRPVKGAVVTLYRYNPYINRFAPFDISQFNQENPVLSGTDGEFGWVVPYGRYEIRVESSGHRSYRSSELVMLRNGVLREEVILARIPLGFLGQVWYFLRRSVQTAVTFVSDLWQSLRDARLVEQLTLPLLLLTIVAILVEFFTRTGLNWRTLPKALSFLLLPRHVRPWGEVRDTANGQPVSLVYLELFNGEGRKVDWVFTNRKGEFGFKEPRGKYFLKLSKRGYQIPDWEYAGDAPVAKLQKMIRVDSESEEVWLQIWISSSLKVPGRPGLSQVLKITEGFLLNLTNFAILLGLLAGAIAVSNRAGPQAWAILGLYLALLILWTFLLWFR